MAGLVEFFTPVDYGCQPLTAAQSLLQSVDSYFYLRGRKAIVVPGKTELGREGTKLEEGKNPSCLSTVLKIASYATIVFPLIILLVKVILRSYYKYYVIQNAQLQRPSQQAPSQQRPPQQPHATSSQFPVSETLIQNGYGEFIVTRSEADQKHHGKINKQLYEKVYAIFLKYSPHNMALRFSGKELEEQYANRHQAIQNEVTVIDSTLQVTFIPRTLYDMIFLRKAIECQVKKFQNKRSPSQIAAEEKLDKEAEAKMTKLSEMRSTLSQSDFSKQWAELTAQIDESAGRLDRRLEWERIQFEDIGDVNHEKVIKMAYKLNQIIGRSLGLIKNPNLTMEDIQKFAKKEMEFFTEHLEKCQKMRDSYYKPPRDRGLTPISVATNFGTLSTKGDLRPLAISKEDQELQELTLNVVRLECSSVAQRAILLYRGSQSQNDGLRKRGQPHSVSYGTSLFAGAMFDPDATAFRWMFREIHGHMQEASVLPLALSEDHSKMFHIPTTNAICQLVSKGEFFHARTKLCIQSISQRVTGVTERDKKAMAAYIESDWTEEQLTKAFNGYKAKTIVFRRQKTAS